MHKSLKSQCLLCGKTTARARYKYCSNACQQDYQYKTYINDWKEGKLDGLRNIGVVSRPIKRYLREKFENKCCLCGWSEVNQKTGLVPLVADHIDGDYSNNKEDNLRLVCPNCDSLGPTYGALNKGRGRTHRVASKRSFAKGSFS